MSDLSSKKTRIIQCLADPAYAGQTDSEIARAVGCESSTVRKVRGELETERLRAENVELRAKVAACQCHDFPAKRPAAQVEAPRRPRRVRDDNRPLWERPGADGSVDVLCEVITIGPAS